jgi:hypothetical protein
MTDYSRLKSTPSAEGFIAALKPKGAAPAAGTSTGGKASAVASSATDKPTPHQLIDALVPKTGIDNMNIRCRGLGCGPK